MRNLVDGCSCEGLRSRTHDPVPFRCFLMELGFPLLACVTVLSHFCIRDTGFEGMMGGEDDGLRRAEDHAFPRSYEACMMYVDPSNEIVFPGAFGTGWCTYPRKPSR